MEKKERKHPDVIKSIERVRAKVGRKTPEQIAEFERGIIHKTTDDIKRDIARQSPEPPEQQIFSFLPTKMTRVSPFFPLSKTEMKDRPIEKLSWDNPWGRFTVTGERLSVYDESVLLAVLSLMRKYRSGTYETTRYMLCKVMNVTPCRNTYKAIWGSLDRLTGTKINLSIWGEKVKGKRRRVKRQMVNTILSGAEEDEKTKKIQITVNPYFLNMYAEGLLTNVSLEFRAGLTGDITKALYRFYQGQRENVYQCHILTLATAINLNENMELSRLRSRIRTGLRELKRQGYIKNWSISKSDIVYCAIEDTKRRKALPVKA